MKIETMKNTLNCVAYSIVFCIVITLTNSCAKKGRTDPKSDNYNAEVKKDDGSCVPWRDKFAGTYSVSDNCITSGSTYSLTITNSSDNEDKIVITAGTFNFDAEVTGQNTADIPEQQGNAVFTISGGLDISGKTITMNYSLSSQDAPLTCTATGDRL